MAQSTQEAEERKKFFDHLFSLDDDDEEEALKESNNNYIYQSGPRRQIYRRHTTSVKRISVEERAVSTVPTLNRAHTAPSTEGHNAEPISSESAEDRRTGNTLTRTSGRDFSKRPRVSGPQPDSKSMSSAKASKTGSRKASKNQLPPIPEHRRIFRGLVFYFMPNDNVGMARRMRIQKAEQYGARWSKDWDESITHIVADRDIPFKVVLKHLNMDAAPPEVVVVNENYPAECIAFMTMLNGLSSRFRLDGHEIASAGGHQKPDAQKVSMQLPVQQQFNSPSPEPPATPASDAPTTKSPVSAGLGSTVPDSQPSVCMYDEEEEAMTNYHDDLNEIIKDTKKIGHLPIELEEDPRSSLKSGESMDSPVDSDDEGSQVPPKKRAKKGTASNLSMFACMHKSEGNRDQGNPNSRTMEVLQEMATYYDRTGDSWRTRAYRKAISELRKLDVKITRREQAIQLPNVGERLADKIEEIVWTDRLRRLEATTMEPNDQGLLLFMGIYGAGYAQASKWIAQGHRTLEDLRTKAELTSNQKVGIEHYDDFMQRIPRDEVSRHGEIVRKQAQKQDAKMQVIVGGSYRRGSPSSGDIDLLITKEGASLSDIKRVMGQVIAHLKKSKFLVASLATGGNRGSDSGSKWHGASCLPDSRIWRRIDLLFVPWDELGAALIYFTGNDIFNRSLRLLASRNGMRLNQHGLYGDVLRGAGRTKVTEGKLIEGQDEKRIFEILGVPYRPPEHRVC